MGSARKKQLGRKTPSRGGQKKKDKRPGNERGKQYDKGVVPLQKSRQKKKKPCNGSDINLRVLGHAGPALVTLGTPSPSYNEGVESSDIKYQV